MATINSINNTIAAANFTVPAGSATITGAFTTSGGAVSINSGTASFDMSNDASATTVNIGTGAAVKTVAIGSSNSTSSLSLRFGGSTGGTLSTYIAPTAWTPVLTFGGGSTGITYSIQTGIYSQIGSMVTFQMEILLTNKGSSTGSCLITGLPGTASPSDNAASLVYSVLTFTTAPTAQVILSGTTVIQLMQAASTATFATLTDANFANTTRIQVSGRYFV